MVTKIENDARKSKKLNKAKVGVDISIIIHKYIAHLKNGEEDKAVDRIISYLKQVRDTLDVIIVCVFDGHSHYLKKDTQINRAQKMKKGSLKVTNILISKLKERLNNPGVNEAKINYYTAPYEAEPQLVFLQKLKIIHMMLSSNGDCIALGSDFFIKTLKFGKSQCFEMFVRSEYIIDKDWKPEHYAVLHALLENDYFPRIKEFGPKTIIKSIKDLIRSKNAEAPLPMNAQAPPPASEAVMFKKSTFIADYIDAILKPLLLSIYDRNQEKVNQVILRLNQTIAIYRYHIVYNPIKKKLVYLSELLSNKNSYFITQTNPEFYTNFQSNILREEVVEIGEIESVPSKTSSRRSSNASTLMSIEEDEDLSYEKKKKISYKKKGEYAETIDMNDIITNCVTLSSVVKSEAVMEKIQSDTAPAGNECLLSLNLFILYNYQQVMNKNL